MITANLGRQLAEPQHVGRDELAVLRWIAAEPRMYTLHPPSVNFSLAAVCRRRLRTVGLIHLDVPPDSGPPLYRLTEAGREYLATDRQGGES